METEPKTDPTRQDKRLRSAPEPRNILLLSGAAIFVLALVVRRIHLWQIQSAPFFSVLIGDAQGYDLWAQRIAGGNWLGDDVFYQAPLYPYFIGLVYAIAGRDLMILRLCQAVLGSLSCVFLAAAGANLFSRRTGIVAGVLLALYAPAIFFDGIVQKSALDLFFFCLSLWFLSRLIDRPERPGVWFWLGTALAALSLTRENALLLIVIVLIWIALRFRSSGMARLKWAVLFLVGLACLLSPIALRNRLVGGEWHLTTSQFGPNFYIGNNEDADGLYRPLRSGRGSWEFERSDAVEIAEKALGRSLTPSEVSAYWTERTFRYIKSQPIHWLRLMGKKLFLSLNAVEVVDTESQETHEERSALLRFLALVGHFGILVPLAFIGLWLTGRDRSRIWLLYAILLGYAGTLILFFIFARYRYPLVPILILFASAGLARLPHLWRKGSKRTLVPLTIGTIVLAVLCNWPVIPADTMRAVTENDLGLALQEQGRLDEAIRQYRRAIELNPRHAASHSNLGTALAQREELDEAIAEFREAVRLHPNDLTHRNLGRALLEKGGPAAAIEHLRRAAELQPDDVAAHIELGNLLIDQGRFEEAIGQFREAVRVDGHSIDAINNLGVALGSIGRLEEAIEQFEAALRLDPGSEDARRNLETAIAGKRR